MNNRLVGLCAFLFATPNICFGLDYVKNTYTADGWVLSDRSQPTEIRTKNNSGTIQFQYILHYVKPKTIKELNVVSAEYGAIGTCFGERYYTTVARRYWNRYGEYTEPMEWERFTKTDENFSLLPLKPNSIDAVALDFACSQRYGSKYKPQNYAVPPANAVNLLCTFEAGIGQDSIIFDDKTNRLWWGDKFVPSPSVTTNSIQFHLLDLNYRISRVNGSIQMYGKDAMVRGTCDQVSSRRF